MSGPVHVSALIAGYLNGLHGKQTEASGMKQTKWHFELHDGKGGIIIMPKPATEQEVIEACRHRFGEERLKEVTS